MTEAKLRALFKLWEKRLGLSEWDIRIVVKAFGPDGNVMRCHKSPEYNRAHIEVQPWVLTGKPPAEYECGAPLTLTKVEEAIVHELLHCVTARYWVWQRLIEPECHTDAFDTAMRALDVIDESIVDALAAALVRAFGQHTLKPIRKRARNGKKR